MTPLQTRSMNSAVEAFTANATAKYPKGQKEHTGNLWERKHLIDSADEEVVDMMFYLAAIKQKRSAISFEMMGIIDSLESEFPMQQKVVAAKLRELVYQLETL